jgi:DNA-binding MarR family transcriptional regulator
MTSGAASHLGDVSLPLRNYRLIHEVFVLLDAGDRQILGQFDVISSQYRLMMNLSHSSGQRLTALSERLLLSKSTITRNVDQLEARGWVQRIADPEDRRAQRVVLTLNGSNRCAAIAEEHLRSLDQRFELLPARDQEQLQVLLWKLGTGLSRLLAAENGKPIPPEGPLPEGSAMEVDTQTDPGEIAR